MAIARRVVMPAAALPSFSVLARRDSDLLPCMTSMMTHNAECHPRPLSGGKIVMPSATKPPLQLVHIAGCQIRSRTAMHPPQASRHEAHFIVEIIVCFASGLYHRKERRKSESAQQLHRC